MSRSKRIWGGVLIVLVLGAIASCTMVPVNVPLTGWLLGSQVDFEEEAALQERISLPPGYAINIYATGIADARLMQITPVGDLLVTSSADGQLVLVRRDSNGDGRGDSVEVLEDGLTLPHGIWLDGEMLYVAEEHQVIRYRYNVATGAVSEKTVVLKGLPNDDGHHTRTIKKGPDGWFYVTVGSSCNVCFEEHPWRAAMIRFKPGSEPELFASGLRNTVGFDWQPGTGDLYGVDNGRDWLGDDFPPDELNRIVKGGFYGWPYFNGANKPDEDYGADPDAKTLKPITPAHPFGAHVAPLSITFLKAQSGRPLEGAALVGQHGSWNRNTKAGYNVVSLHWDTSGRITERPFAAGFEQDDDVIGRPVDVVETPDGTIFISDDFAGAIYRVSYTQP